MKKVRSHLTCAGIACGVTLFILLLEMFGTFYFLKLKAYDFFTVAKTVVAPVEYRAPISLIAIDDATLETEPFTIPLSSWHTMFDAVLNGMADANASVVGMDFLLPERLFDHVSPEFKGFSRKWLKPLADIRRKGLPAVFNYVQFKERVLLPALPYRFAIGRENLALANLRTDRDDFVRHHKLWYEGQDGSRVHTFAWAIAIRHDPTLEATRGTGSPDMAIDFLFPVPAFPTYPMHEVYARAKAGDMDWLREHFAGRIVLIGATNALDKDFIATPMNFLATGEKRKMPGVEVHAQIINTLLSGVTHHELPTYGKIALYLLLGFAAAAGVIFANRQVMFGLEPLLMAVFLGISLWLFTHNIELPVVKGVGAIILGGAVALLWREYGMEREKKLQRKLFQRYLPSHVVDKLMEMGDAEFFKGERRELCILFSDIRGFTTWSKDQPPQEVVGRLNEYFEAMTQVVQHHGGVVDKFLGDGLLAFFGIVKNDESPSLSGGKAALEMQDVLESLNAAWALKGEHLFKIGVGMHTGPVMVGNIGSQSKSEFTVIGDPVNVASRLESMTKQLGCPILVTEAFYDDVKSSMVFEDQGEVAVRGHSTMHAYALVSLAPAAPAEGKGNAP